MKLFYRVSGSGPPLLLLHGLFGSSDNWRTIATELSGSHQIYLIDLRNHGRSPHTTDFNYDVMIDDIYELITDLNLRKISLIGHSMGGMTAMNFTIEYQHRIDKLVIIDIAPKRYPVLHQRIIRGLQAINLEGLRSRNEADAELSNYISESHLRQFLLKNLYRGRNSRYAWRINLPVIANNISRIGEGIVRPGSAENPALFLRGAKSDYILDSDLKTIQDLFPNSRVVTIPDAGHWLHSDAPSRLIEELRSFLNSD